MRIIIAACMLLTLATTAHTLDLPLPPKYLGEWCQVGMGDVETHLLKPCSQIAAGRTVPIRFTLSSEQMVVTYPDGSTTTCATIGSMLKFEGSYDGFIMRFACNGKTRKSTYMFWRFSEDATGRRGTYLNARSMHNTQYERAFERIERIYSVR